ncbi:MAG: hypothetical protein MJ105_01995 [Lachnospiraceae bacterium]|nr:hypothetical protein [Lachnospiraceae bacterium]
MKDIVSKIARAVIFVMGLLLLLYGLSRMVVVKEKMDQHANAIVSEPEQTIDVLVLGNSETYSSVVPLKLWEQKGITAYCCGTPDQRLFYAKEFLEKTFKNQSPLVVMIETDMLYNGSAKNDEVVHKLSTVFPVFLYHNRWKTLSFSDFVHRNSGYGVEENKGYSYDLTIVPASTDGYMDPSELVEVIPKRNQEYIRQIKEYCDERGALLVLYSTPSTVNWNMRRHNGVEILAEDIGIDYVDLNILQADVGIDWRRDTRDKGDHMNYWGANKVTGYLGEYLHSLGILVDHRGDERYQDWDIYLDSFNQQLAQDSVE